MGDVVLAEAELSQDEGTVFPKDHGELWDLEHEFGEWIAQPVLLKRPPPAEDAEESEDNDTNPAWTPDPISLPRMPTPEGQIALLDFWFPIDPAQPLESDLEGRAAAARKLIEFFPSSHAAQFAGGMTEVLNDVLNSDKKDLVDRARRILTEHGPHVTPRQRSGGQVLIAVALIVQGRKTEAFEMAAAIAVDPTPILPRGGPRRCLPD